MPARRSSDPISSIRIVRINATWFRYGDRLESHAPGRFGREGPKIYASSTQKTASAEAAFRASRLNLVPSTTLHRIRMRLSKVADLCRLPKELERLADRLFGEDHAASQRFSERLREAGFQGAIWSSLCGRGHNLVIWLWAPLPGPGKRSAKRKPRHRSSS